MSFWDLFTSTGSSENGEKFSSKLHKKLADQFNGADDQELTKWACIAGLLARVANIDLEITKDEEQNIVDSIVRWAGIDEQKAIAVKNIAIEDLTELAGLENHKYCSPLNEILSKNERYSLLETLFALAASDGQADNQESEEIRVISRGLLLGNKEFIAARATVLEFLAAAKAKN